MSDKEKIADIVITNIDLLDDVINTISYKTISPNKIVWRLEGKKRKAKKIISDIRKLINK